MLGIALIAMGEDIGADMCLRAFGHLVSGHTWQFCPQTRFVGPATKEYFWVKSLHNRSMSKKIDTNVSGRTKANKTIQETLVNYLRFRTLLDFAVACRECLLNFLMFGH